jgi:hypothetical protein
VTEGQGPGLFPGHFHSWRHHPGVVS